jgi:3-oxoacyl-[acyl-carrier protein] reductase
LNPAQKFPNYLESIRMLANQFDSCRNVEAMACGRSEDFMSKLNGKVALVTGASKGIGAAIALELAQQGAAVAVNYSGSKSGADKVVAEITKAGGKAIAVQANVADPDSIGPLIAAVAKQLGPIDILVNNAGIYEFRPIEQVTPEHFHKQFNVNVLGLLLTTQEALKHFGPTGGSIINIGSVAAAGVPTASVYSATKGALDSITVALAGELGPRKIRVNSLNPGMVETEGVHSAGFIGSDFQKKNEAETPLGRIGQPKDVASIAAFLASDDSYWVTGQTIKASGGARL